MNRRKKYLACFLILMIISTNLPAISSGNVKKEEEVKQSYSTISTSDTLSSGIILSDSSLSGTVAGEQSSEECFVDGETEANTSENGQTTTDTPAPGTATTGSSDADQTEPSASTDTTSTSTTEHSAETNTEKGTEEAKDGTTDDKSTTTATEETDEKQEESTATCCLSGSISLTTDLGTEVGAYSVRLYDADSYSATSYDHVTAGQATCTDDDSTFYINHLPEGNYRIEYISMNPNFDISLYQVAGENAYSVELTDGQEYFAVISSFTLKEDTFIDWELEDFVESGLIEDDFQNLTVASLGGSYVKNSLNFTYNGTLTNRNFLYSSLMSKGSGLTEITSNLANNINRYYVIKQDNLDDAISKNCYLKFSNAFFTSDVNGNTTYYDVKIYFWGESLGSTTNKPAVGFTSTDRFVYGCQAHFDGDTSLGDGSGRFVLKSQYRFYPAGDSEENEVYPSGVFYTGDNDEDEGWCALNAGTLFTPFSDNTIKTATVQGNQYLVGTTDVTNQSASGEDPSADIGCYFSTSANGGRLRLAYTANDGRSSPVKGFYYTLKYHIVGKNGTPANASAKPMDINVARYINTSSQKATLFREMTAAGYIFNGWYTSSSDLSGTKYSGETSTTSNINVYAEFVPATGDLTIMKEINGWTSTLSTENRTFTFRLSGTSTTEETVDQTETLEFEAEAPTSKSVTFSDVPVGTYTLTETFTDRYWNTTTSTKTITIENSKTTTVNFTNTLKVGHLNVNKIIEEADPLLYIPSVEDRYNSSLAGFAFRLYGTSDYDTKIDLYAVTDSTGYAAFADVETGTYTLTEASLEDVMAAADQGNTNNGWCYTG